MTHTIKIEFTLDELAHVEHALAVHIHHEDTPEKKIVKAHNKVTAAIDELLAESDHRRRMAYLSKTA